MTAALDTVYQASTVKPRRRATRSEMEERAEFLIEYANAHGPVTVRGLYYQAEVHGVPGIDKTDAGYAKIQAQVLSLRRAGRMPYKAIADATRWMRKPDSFDGPADALAHTAAFYRRSLWREATATVEIWCEKDALAGVIYPVTSLYDVPLMVTRGFSSETFAYEAIAARGQDKRPYVIFYLGDFDRAGHDAARSLEEKLKRFAAGKDFDVQFHVLAVTDHLVRYMKLPTRPPKRVSPADRKWPYAYACELDAIPPDFMRNMVEAAINQHLSQRQLAVLKAAEKSERELIASWANEVAP